MSKTKAQKTVDITNNVIGRMSKEYAERIPEATIKNIEAVSNPILEYTAVMNEFVDTLVNKVGLTIIRQKMARNPLSLLKKGDKPLGQDVEEVFTEMAKAKPFDREGNGLLNRADAESYAIYHRLNRQDYYEVSFSRNEIKRAFTSWDALAELIDSMVNSLYSGAYHDEYLLTKQLMVDGVEKGIIQTTEVVEPTDEQTAKTFAKEIRTHSGYMTYMGNAYNTYKKPDGEGVNTFTPLEKQVLILKESASVEMDVELLAYAFNMSKTDFSSIGKIIKVDNFNDREDIVGILCDISLFQIYDDLFDMQDKFYNPANMVTKYYLHVHQTFSLSKFSNAIAFVKNDTVEE